MFGCICRGATITRRQLDPLRFPGSLTRTRPPAPLARTLRRTAPHELQCGTALPTPFALPRRRLRFGQRRMRGSARAASESSAVAGVLPQAPRIRPLGEPALVA